ncbi:MAG TPA: type IV secretion system protein, partial [Steroidobacteraceae bacterium]
MRSFSIQWIVACLSVSLAGVPTARAQWAVIDAPAIVQLIQEEQTMAQQLATARAQLLQAQQALQTMTGNRGMELLLSGTLRNYQPTNWAQVTGVMQGSGGFSTLSSEVQNLVTANAVLSAQRLATLSPGAQQLIQSQRQWSAMQQ